MDVDPEILKIIGGGTLAGALLALIYIVGMRLVAAIDRIGAAGKADGVENRAAIAALGGKIEEHADTENDHHVAVRSEIAGLKGQIGGIMDAASRLTPAHGLKPPRG